MAGEAILNITIKSNNVQISNFGKNSFQIKNTGDKTIAKVEIDVTKALYPDAVFDPFGKAGDTVSKPLTIDTNGSTGVVAPSNASYIGAGGSKGFKGIQLVFNKDNNNGFDPGETVGFSIDMDSNSVAGTKKKPLDAGTNPSWDVGGVSGAELIGSTFKVTFNDGTTATGQLQGADNQAGAQALASQDSPDLSVALKVNGLDAGDVGTYDANPSVVVNGPAGETARVVLTKGFIQPVTPYAQFLQNQLDVLAASDFPANNAVEFQTVDVKLTGKAQNISNLFNFSNVAKFDFKGEDKLPLGFVASIIDPSNNNLPIGPIKKPIYLEFQEQISEPEPEPKPEPNPDSSAIRINAGGNGYTDQAGNVWLADKYFVGGKTYQTKSAIAKTTDDPLYQTERWQKNLSYNVPVENGDYQVTLKFAEIFWSKTGARVFDAFAEGKNILDNLDLFSDAGGKNVAFDHKFTINVDDGNLDLDFVSSLDHAKVAAIEIIPADDSNPNPNPEPEPEPQPEPEPNPDSSAIRINAGGNAYTDLNGNLWDKDTYFSGGKKYTTTDAINRTELDTIYQSERFSKEISYNIPVDNGLYSVNLHFAEIYLDAPNLRKFDVSIEGEKVVDDLDIHESTKNAFDPGHDTALVLNFPQVEVTDGNFDLDLSASLNNAKISGLELIPLQGAQVILQESQGNTEVTENGNGDSYSLILTEKPSNNVIIAIKTDNLLKTNKSQVIFTPENWSTAQNVVVNALNNNQASGTKFGSISHKVTSNDSDYNGYELPNLSVKVNDDEVAPINFTKKTFANNFDGATVGTWGPDGRLYVGSYNGTIKAFSFDDNYNLIDTDVINTLKGKSNPNILGIAFNPFDSSKNPKIYVSHSQLFANGGKAFPETDLSPYSGQVSVLSGSNFSKLTPLITGLPVSNHDHGVNDITFDNQGDLFVSVGGNTNAGITHNKIGGIPESPFTAAILKAKITKPNFNGDIEYTLPKNFNPPKGLKFDPADSQVFGDVASVVPGVDLSVYASGLRNPFSQVLTTKNLFYTLDNGANGSFGDVSTSANTQKPFGKGKHDDELNLVVKDGYYGFPNRNRGKTDDRQNVYYGPSESSKNGYTAPLTTAESSTNGLDEYRATSFSSQLKGDLIVQKYNGQVSAFSLSGNGKKVNSKQTLNNVADGLDVFTAPRGAIVGVDFIDDKVTVALPDDASIGNEPTAVDIFPWRAPASGGNLFTIGGHNFDDLTNTSVTIGGEVAQINSVSDGLIHGTLPSIKNTGELLDVVVESGGSVSVLEDAFFALT